MEALRPILTVSTPPADDPVSLADMKAHLRIDHSDDDALISAYLEAVVSMLDGPQGKLKRAIMRQTWIQSQRGCNGANVVWLELPPVDAITAVEYYDDDFNLQSATLADFTTIDQNDGFKVVRPVPGKDWPDYTVERADSLRITFTTGAETVADVPPAIIHAIKLLTAHFYHNAEATTDLRLRDIPFGIEALLEPYRSKWVA